MLQKITQTETELVNDMNDFKMPYRLYGKTDLEVMADKYSKLKNNSHGLVVRFRME